MKQENIPPCYHTQMRLSNESADNAARVPVLRYKCEAKDHLSLIIESIEGPKPQAKKIFPKKPALGSSKPRHTHTYVQNLKNSSSASYI